MAQKTYLNIQFPFREDPEGKFIELTRDFRKAIKSDLMHLLLTNKGERLYMPDFGANLRRYLFEPNDEAVLGSIKNEITQAVKTFMPNLTISELTVTPIEGRRHAVIIRIDYVVTINALETIDFIELEL